MSKDASSLQLRSELKALRSAARKAANAFDAYLENKQLPSVHAYEALVVSAITELRELLK